MRDRQGEQARRMRPDELAQSGRSSNLGPIKKDAKIFVGEKNPGPESVSKRVKDFIKNSRPRF